MPKKYKMILKAETVIDIFYTLSSKEKIRFVNLLETRSEFKFIKKKISIPSPQVLAQIILEKHRIKMQGVTQKNIKD